VKADDWSEVRMTAAATTTSTTINKDKAALTPMVDELYLVAIRGNVARTITVGEVYRAIAERLGVTALDAMKKKIVTNQLDGLMSGTATALSAAEGRGTEMVSAIDQQAPAAARAQPLDDDNTKQIDPFLKYQNGFFRYCKRKNNGNLQKYRCTRYCSRRSSFPEVWVDYKSVKAFPAATGGEVTATQDQEALTLVCCTGVMYIPHQDGVGGCPWFTGTHECRWKVPRLLLGEHDDRPTINLVQLDYSAVGLTSPAVRAALIEELENKGGIWEGLTGGGAGKRKYAKHLSEFPNLETRVVMAMTWYVRYMQATYLALKHVKYVALKTAPQEASQYRRHSDKLHSDYQVECGDRPPHQRLISIIVALNAFHLIYLPTKLSSRKELVTTTVAPGQMVWFTDKCLHSGGPNDTDDTVYRLFAYMASCPFNIP
jgi:hypothetical protein